MSCSVVIMFQAEKESWEGGGWEDSVMRTPGVVEVSSELLSAWQGGVSLWASKENTCVFLKKGNSVEEKDDQSD